MKLYFKILLSIALGSLMLSHIFALVFSGIESGIGQKAEQMSDTLQLALVGFALFGISGSILWYMFYCYKFGLKYSETNAHIRSVVMSAISIPTLLVLSKIFEFHLIFSSFVGLIGFVVVIFYYFLTSLFGGLLSLFFYWIIFIRGKATFNNS